MNKFKIGDHVRWVRAVGKPENQNSEGRILAVFSAAFGVPAFNLYEIEFEFGRVSLYGTQIEPAVGTKAALPLQRYLPMDSMELKKSE